jgi:hypothetical protein
MEDSRLGDGKQALKLLRSGAPSFRHLHSARYSYVQCLGAKTRLTVEAREFQQNGSFNHWVFGRGAITGTQERIGVSTGDPIVDSSQMLAMRDARIIIRHFLETRTFPLAYHRQDVTPNYLAKPGAS